MAVQIRNHVQVAGQGGATMVFVHGFGCGGADLSAHRHPVRSSLAMFATIGHCPRMSTPTAGARAIDLFPAHALR